MNSLTYGLRLIWGLIGMAGAALILMFFFPAMLKMITILYPAALEQQNEDYRRDFAMWLAGTAGTYQ